MAENNITKFIKTCQVEECDEKHWGRGYCLKHYNYARRNGLLGYGICKIDGCENPVDSQGLCHKHYAQVRRVGYTHRTRNDPNIFEEIDNGYLIWLCDSQGHLRAKTTIDLEDYKKTKGLKWCLGSHGYVEHAARNLLLHHHIFIKPMYGYEIDHRDRNKLNNRRSNLRIADHTHNNANIGLRSDNKTGLKGVSWNKLNKKYVAQIGYYKNNMTLGLFVDKYDAARVYDKKALELYGEFAVINGV